MKISELCQPQLRIPNPVLMAIGQNVRRFGLLGSVEKMHDTYLRMNPWTKDGAVECVLDSLHSE